MAQMEWAISQQKLADDERADLHFALGKGYDDLRDFESAIGHFDRGNALNKCLLAGSIARSIAPWSTAPLRSSTAPSLRETRRWQANRRMPGYRDAAIGHHP